MRALAHNVGAEDVGSDVITDHVNGLDSASTFLHDLVLDKLEVLEMRLAKVLELSIVTVGCFNNSLKRLFVGTSAHEQVSGWSIPAIVWVNSLGVCEVELNILWVDSFQVAVFSNSCSPGVVLGVDFAIFRGD